MQTAHIYLSLSSLWLCIASLSAAVVTIDAPELNSILLENFSGAQNPTQAERNGVAFEGSEGGVATFSIAAETDPQLIFKGYLDGIDFSAYPNVRVRHSFSGGVNEGSVFPIPVRPGNLGRLLINETLAGRQVTLTKHEGWGEGLRLDPIDGAPVAGVYRIDYIIVDRGRTLGFEFDASNSTRGGLNNFFNGNNLGSVDGKEILSGVSEGLYKGFPTSADPMLILQLSPATGLAVINTQVYRFVEIRMRVDDPQDGTATVYFRTDAGGGQAHKVEFDLADDAYFHSYLIDLRDNANWKAGKLTSFRFDPTNRQQTFEIDHIRFYERAKVD